MKTQKALFAAGCFWGVQYYFDQVPGVISTVAGYTGGVTDEPSYDQVVMHTTGHAEALLVTFDTDVIDYATLLRHFFRMHDPTQLNKQGPDIGDNYRTEIFYFNEQQKQIAEDIRDRIQTTMQKQIVTKITPAGPFYEAEAYHQKFSERTGVGMCHIPYEPLTQL